MLKMYAFILIGDRKFFFLTSQCLCICLNFDFDNSGLSHRLPERDKVARRASGELQSLFTVSTETSHNII